jgi:hypothetical protein
MGFTVDLTLRFVLDIRGLTYQDLYLRAFDNGTELREGLAQWCNFYNCERSH